MTPVVRVDTEVWEWLKTLARPLEDTPNSVLRRVAGIDPALPPLAREANPAHPVRRPVPAPRHSREPVEEPATAPVIRQAKRVTGEWLNRTFHLEARHALYHKQGTLFERLTQFPGILCDSKGFVRYDTERQFTEDDALQIGDKVNVPRGLSAHPRYTRFPIFTD